MSLFAPIYRGRKHCIFAVLSLLFVVSACISEPPVECLTISFEGTRDSLPGVKSSYFINVTSCTSWSVQTSEDWCVPNSRSGEGNGVVVITLAENPLDTVRSVQVVFSTTHLSDTLTLCQYSVHEPTPEPIIDSHFREAGSEGPWMEIPRYTGGDTNYVVTHFYDMNGVPVRNYSFEYDVTRRHVRWVAYEFDRANTASNVGRSDEWGDDPEIPIEFRSIRADFYGYDRGHLVASADRLYSREANVQTFYYSNMSPQLANFNQQIWARLEGQIRTWSHDVAVCDTLYVVKGGTIRDDQLLEGKEWNNDRIVVPGYYFMALLALKSGRYEGICFCLKHQSYAAPYIFSDYAMSIDSLESFTGLDLFPNLRDAESAVESSLNLNYWPGL